MHIQNRRKCLSAFDKTCAKLSEMTSARKGNCSVRLGFGFGFGLDLGLGLG